MILRVKKINQVGGFRNFGAGGAIPFADEKKITLVYALNTHGKSTFVNILNSLGDDDPSLVTRRKSVPPIAGTPQEIELSYRAKDATQKNVKFGGGVWTASELKDNILVFDQDFINSHVMLGSAITRDNKELFTDFILGTKGIALSKEIAEEKIQSRDDKKRLRDFRPTFVKGVVDDRQVDAFVDLEVAEDTPTLTKQKEDDEKRYGRIEKIGEFKKLLDPEITGESAETSTIALQNELTQILKENYDGVSDEAWQALQTHMEQNCADDSVAWLKQGLAKTKSHACPFCAQDLNGAKELISTYQVIFDEKFENYELELKKRIQKLESDMKLAVAQSYVQPVNKFIGQAKLYKDFIPGLDEEIAAIETAVTTLTQIEGEFKVDLAKWAQEIDGVLSDKSTSAHRSIPDPINHTPILDKAKIVAEQQRLIRVQQDEIVKHIQNARNTINKKSKEELDKAQEIFSRGIRIASTKIARLAQDKECVTYAAKRQAIIELDKSIALKTKQLENDQSEYLREYFDRLDYWFKQLGSNQAFEIKMLTNNRGDKKVFSLEVYFHGNKISADELGKVFSESDKRNLALSIFLSRAEKVKDKAVTILVFDDPVVSFDDNRRKKTCRELKQLSSDFAQIIVTTHYGSLVKMFSKMNMPAQYVKIDCEENNSTFAVLDPNHFAMSNHERESDRIREFMNGKNDTILSLLRPFMEEHLRSRYQHQLALNGLGEGMLGDLINELNTLGLVSDDNKEKLHTFRETFNPEHHELGDPENVEELRTEARDLMELIYSDLS